MKLRLNYNENKLGCSPKVIKALRYVKAESIVNYPSYNDFKEKLANKLKVKPSQILLTNGAEEAIRVTIETYLDKNDEVIIPTPSFPLYFICASNVKAKIIKINYNENLDFSVSEFLKSINKKTKMIIIENPNSAGSETKSKDIERIIKKAKDSIVLIDETYNLYGNGYKNSLRNYENVLIINSFSKSSGLAGIRLGYIISNENIINDLKKFILPFNVNSLAVIAGSAALDDIAFVKKYISFVKRNKLFLKNELEKLGIKVFSSKTNFLIANFGENCDTVYKKLKERGILVKNETKQLKNCLRIGIGNKSQCIRLIKEIKEILKLNT